MSCLVQAFRYSFSDASTRYNCPITAGRGLHLPALRLRHFRADFSSPTALCQSKCMSEFGPSCQFAQRSDMSAIG
jgi:hypothetical protein